MSKTIYKTVTYSLVHVAIAFFVAWAVSGSLAVALGISLLEPAFQIAAYFLHEKAWMKFGNAPADQNPQQTISCCPPFLIEKLKKINFLKRNP